MSRESFPPEEHLKRSSTNPPKIYDMKYYSEYIDPNDDFNWNPEKVLFSFTFSQTDSMMRSPAYEFLIEIENLDTGVIKSFVQLADVYAYRFWQRQAEFYTESPESDEIDLLTESIVNSRIVVTPINDFGNGPTSTFVLPFRDLIWTRSKDNIAEGTFSVMNTNWDLFSVTPRLRLNRPKIMYIYLDVPEEDILADRILLGQPEWSFDSLSDSGQINSLTYRWSINNNTHKVLRTDGWFDQTQEEKTFLIDLIQTMLPAWRDYLTRKELAFSDGSIFKMGIENPYDNRDTILIYLMKGTRWQL